MAGKNNAVGLRSSIALRLTVRLALLVSLSLAASAINSARAQSSVLQGTVSVSGANGQGERLPGASMKLTPATPGQTTRSVVTNDLGEYKFTDLAAGLYTLQVGLSGFKQHTKSVTIRAGITTDENIVLELEGLSSAVTVVDDSDGLNT